MHCPHFKQTNKKRHYFQQFKSIAWWILTDYESRKHFYRNCPILSRSTTLKKHDCNVSQSKTRQWKWWELLHKNSPADYSLIFNMCAESLPEWSGGCFFFGKQISGKFGNFLIQVLLKIVTHNTNNSYPSSISISHLQHLKRDELSPIVFCHT